MKAKLLKKIRKRFEIFHKPNGVVYFGDRYEYNLFVLIDNKNDYYSETYTQCGKGKDGGQFVKDNRIFNTEKECIDYLKSFIIIQLRSEGYRGAKDRKIKSINKKVWYI